MLPEEIMYNLENPDSEDVLVRIIRKYLLTEKQRQILFNINLSIEDCLNGRYGINEETAINEIYADWNKMCGKKLFGF